MERSIFLAFIMIFRPNFGIFVPLIKYSMYLSEKCIIVLTSIFECLSNQKKGGTFL